MVWIGVIRADCVVKSGCAASDDGFNNGDQADESVVVRP